ncbi:MAG: hypothetical protein IJX68_00035 [Rikenellaceae bacterium]|nr:hypothetical protein [Rikenellaceae bacterium]
MSQKNNVKTAGLIAVGVTIATAMTSLIYSLGKRMGFKKADKSYVELRNVCIHLLYKSERKRAMLQNEIARLKMENNALKLKLQNYESK